MADGPWRCSQCGTVNEPVANSCRTCGRWPSLFDLEASVIDESAVEDEREPAPTAQFPAEPVTEEPTLEPVPFEPVPVEPEPVQEPFEDDFEEDAGDEPDGTRRGRRLASYLVPIAFAVYLVISIVFGDR